MWGAEAGSDNRPGLAREKGAKWDLTEPTQLYKASSQMTPNAASRAIF